MNIRNKSIFKVFTKRDKLIYILIAIEMVISIFLFYNLQKELVVKVKVDSLDSYYWNKDNCYSVSINGLEFNSQLDKSIEKFYNSLKKVYGIEGYGILYPEYMIANNLKANYSDDIQIKFSGFGEVMASDADSEGNGAIPVRLVTEEYISKLNIKLEEGSISNDKDRVILGNRFKDYYKLNDKINLNDKEFIVSGIAEANQAFEFDDIMANTDPFLDDSAFILIDESFLKTEGTFNLIALSSGINISIKDGKESEVKNEILNIAKENDLKITLTNSKEQYNDSVSEVKAMTKYSTFRILFCLIIAIISLITIILYSIYDLKREIGIAILLGANKKDVAIVTSFKIIVLSLISYCVATILAVNIDLTSGGHYLIKLTGDMGIRAFLGVILFDLLVLIVPIVVIIRLKVRDLIGGER